MKVIEGGVAETVLGRSACMADAIGGAIKNLAGFGYTNFHTRLIRNDGDYRVHLVSGVKIV